MTKDSSLVNNLVLEKHKKLVNLIIEEAGILEKTTSKNEKERHKLILEFLIDYQCLTSRGL